MTGADALKSDAGSTTWAVVITGGSAALAPITAFLSTGGLGDRPGAGPATWILLVTVVAAGPGVVAVWPHHARRNR
jgi:hypothetical protein